MGEYVLLDGVRTWYAEHGNGDPLVLLHPGGAGVDARAFGPNLGPLAERFCVQTPDRRAHGHTPDIAGSITFDAMAQDTIAFIETVVGRSAHVLGCSDGAIVGLLVALRRPDLIDRLVLVAGVFHFEGWLPEVIDPNKRAFGPRRQRAHQPRASVRRGAFEIEDPVPTMAPIRRALSQ